MSHCVNQTECICHVNVCQKMSIIISANTCIYPFENNEQLHNRKKPA